MNHLCFQKVGGYNVQKYCNINTPEKKHTCEVDVVLVRVVPQLEMRAEELARGDPPEPGRVLLRGVPAVSAVDEEEDEVKRHSNRIQVRNNT